MSNHEIGRAECPFSGQEKLVTNVKFFRGRRDDVITADEILGEARSAMLQHSLGTATVSATAPVSSHPVVDVKEFVANL